MWQCIIIIMWEEDGTTWVDSFVTRMGLTVYFVSFPLIYFKCHFNQRLSITYVISIWCIIAKFFFVWVLHLVTFIYFTCFKGYSTIEPIWTFMLLLKSFVKVGWNFIWSNSCSTSIHVLWVPLTWIHSKACCPWGHNQTFMWDFDILLTVHLSIILVINQLNAQNLVL